MGITILPCALATTTVYSTQALGFAKSTIPAFILSCVLRVAINYLFIPKVEINIIAAAFSNFAGFIVIIIMNICVIRKKTNAKISYLNVFVKPIICAVISYFITVYIKNKYQWNFYENLFLMICCVLIYLVLLIITKTIEIKLLNTPKKL